MKNLLRGSENDQLTTYVLSLCAAMSAVSVAHAGWNLLPQLSEDAAYADRTNMCKPAYTSGKQAIIVIAAVIIIENCDCTDPVTAAILFLAKRRLDLPAPLVAILSDIAKEGTAPKPTNAKMLRREGSGGAL